MLRENSGALTYLEAIEGVLRLVLTLSAAALVLITGYYIFAVTQHSDQLFRGVGDAGSPMAVPDFQRHIAQMDLLTRVMLLCVVLIVTTAVARYYASPETGLALLVLGAALFFGMPYVIDQMGGQGTLAVKLSKLGDPRSFLRGKYVLAGLGLMGAGLIDLLCHGIAFALNARERRPKANEDAARTAAQVKKSNDRFLGPCWTLPFCRDTDKKLCPIRHSKKPCWRTGRGCYCDQNIILTLSGGSQYAATRGSSGYLSRSATVARPKSLSEKRQQCLQCPVYLHHQGQKYRLLAPAWLLAIIGVLVYRWDTVKTLYPNAMESFGRALSSFSFGPSTGGVPQWALELAHNDGIMWMLVIVAAMLLIGYVLQGLELVLYRLGL